MKKNLEHIHILGICGTGMASMAGLLTLKGYKVTGSDTAAYPPMSDQLKAMNIEPAIGYKPENLAMGADLVIVGNVIQKTNPEMTAVIEKKLPYMSMPEALENLFLLDKESIVVAGTHGKTTTSNLTAWLLESAGKDPSFLIGGVGVNFGRSYKLGNGKYFVVEGDEYDTAFFDKGPKFLHYNPKYAIIGSIEFDHADIYNNLDEIKTAFSKLLNLVPKNGFALVSADDANIRDIISGARCKIITYGFSHAADYKITSAKDFKSFEIEHNGKKIVFETQLIGKHNVLNAAAAVSLLIELGVPSKKIIAGLKLFKGVKRRQEVRGKVRGITVIDDFAHHPTAIVETIKAVRAAYPEKRIWAVFEPRSNTTRRNIFADEIAAALANADISVISEIFNKDKLSGEERLSPNTVAEKINSHGGEGLFLPDADAIAEHISKNARDGDVILVMSNGSFDNIHEKILNGLEKKGGK